MKLLKAVAQLAFCLVCTIQASAQNNVPLNETNYNKPRLFADLPEKAPLHVTELEGLLSQQVGSKVSANIAKNISIFGTIVSKSNPADKSVQSVVIKSLTRQGTIFTFTRVTDTDGSVSYLGRMLNRASGDALEITKEGNGYVIRKQHVAAIVNE
ncbi:MAG TPA: hypothetical protein VGN63_17960 [Flavisolibacter sp.]|jgi:hypothetical protein|nr:hypothetical protein [Flavisolibacter sp.]